MIRQGHPQLVLRGAAGKVEARHRPPDQVAEQRSIAWRRRVRWWLYPMFEQIPRHERHPPTEAVRGVADAHARARYPDHRRSRERVREPQAPDRWEEAGDPHARRRHWTS